MKSKISASTPPKKKQQILEELWLNYFNTVLLESGCITEDEYRRMKLKIIHRTAAISR
jgi:hypothetical protein